MSSSIDGLSRRIDTMLHKIEQQQATLTPDMEARIHAYIREGLSRKLALLGNDLLPDEMSEQCEAIDQDITERMTAAERAALEAFKHKYAGQLSGAKERLLEQLERYNPFAEDAA